MSSVTVTSSERKETGVLTARDSVAGDAFPSEPTAHSAREVMKTGLAGTVCVCFVVRDHDSFDRTNLTIATEYNQ